MIRILTDLFFPPKCILCRKVLDSGEVDLCHECRTNAEDRPDGKLKLSFIDSWSALWYYEDNVRGSLLRYKFFGHRHLAAGYGRLMAIALQQELEDYDLLTWVPISTLRKLRRGYDQVELVAEAIGKEAQLLPISTLKKIRHTRPQSKLKTVERRRANVLGAFAVKEPGSIRGKRVLLLDDIVTTGATAGECARMLKLAGAKKVHLAAIAAARH